MTKEIEQRSAPAPRAGRIARELVVVIVGQVGVAAVGLIGLRTMTTLLSPEQFGMLALGLSISTLFQQVAFGPLAVASLRYAGNAIEACELASFMRDVDRLALQAFCACMAAAVVAGAVVTALGLYHWLAMGALCLWFSAASALLACNLAVDAAMRRRDWVSGMQIGSESMRFAMAAAVITVLGIHSAMAGMGGFAIGMSAAALVQRRRIRAQARAEAESAGAAWRDPLVRFAKPLGVTGALTWAQMASDRWSLNAMISTTQVGVYSAVYQIAVAPFSMLGATIQQLIAPIAFRIAGTGSDRDAVRASHLQVLFAVGALLVVTTVAALVAWRMHDVIFALLVGPGFASYSELLPLGVIAGGVLAAGQVVGTTVMSRGDTKRLVFPKAATAALGLVLNILGAKYYGVVGVLTANMIFSLVFFIWMFALASTSHPAPAVVGDVIDHSSAVPPSPDRAWIQ